MSENTPPATEGRAKLAEALSKAQAEIKPPVKNRHVDFQPKSGGRVKYSYADLADVIEAVRVPLSKNGLAIVHQLEYSKSGYGLKTVLMHSSGEFVDTWYPLPDPSKQEIRAQEFGSALTYARRYSLSSIVGIASEEDDDGANAAPTQPPKQQQKMAPAEPKSAPHQAKNQPRPSNRAPASEEMINTIHSYCIDRDINEGVINKLIVEGYGVNKGAIPIWIADEIIDLVSQPDTNAATVMAECVRVQRRRAEAAQKANSPVGGES